MANDILRRFGAFTQLRAVPASLGHAPAPVRALPVPHEPDPDPMAEYRKLEARVRARAPHVVPVNPHPCEPTPADWVADWILETRIPWLTFSQAKWMVARVLDRAHLRKPLTPWEAEILAAWDTTCSSWAVEMAEEGLR